MNIKFRNGGHMSTKRKKKKSTNRKYYKTHPKENLDIANIVSTKKLKISFAFILIILFGKSFAKKSNNYLTRKA